MVVRPRRNLALQAGNVVPSRRFVITVPTRFEGDFLRGIASTVLGNDADLWILCVPETAQPHTIGRLLAALAVNVEETIAPPSMMPSMPSTLYLLPSGELRAGRGKRLAPWAIEEIERLATVLCSEHQSYIEDILAALRREDNSRFGSIPADFIFRDREGAMRIGPSPVGLRVDVGRSERRVHNLGWHQVVGADYQRNRYLAHLTDEQLGERTEHIVANAHVVDAAGLISLDSGRPETFYWLGRLQEVMTEMALRHGPYPAGWRRGLIEFTRMPGSLDSQQLNRNVRLPPRTFSSVLVKYTQLQFAHQLLDHGLLRLAPAASYNDPSLNTAIRDQELLVDIDFNPFTLGIGHDPELDRIIFPSQRRLVRIEASSNYYVYCMSESYCTRLLFDFAADAAVVIHDREAFIERTEAALRSALPGSRSVSGAVEYYDPTQISPHEIALSFSKHFKYAYQEEFRLTAVPPVPGNKTLQPIFLRVGSLRDIAEIVAPEPTDPRPAL